MIVPHVRCSLQGSFVALPTPFRNGEIDYAALQTLIEWHVAEKTDGLVIAGTTGEAATLSDLYLTRMIEVERDGRRIFAAA